MSDFPSTVEECESKLFSLWAEIGYTSNEKENQQNKIKDEIISIFQKLIEKTNEEKVNLQQEIDKSLDTYANLSKALGKSQKLQYSEDSSLRQKYNEINIAYNKLYKDSKDIINKFKQVQNEISNNFSILGTPVKDRGEFSSVGNKDLSDMRYQRYIQKNQELSNEIETRQRNMSNIKKEIIKICAEIEVQVSEEVQEIFNENRITDDSFTTVNAFLKQMSEEKEKRKGEMMVLVKEIAKLWSLLNVSDAEKTAFVNSHSTLGTESISFCKSELERLNKQRLEQLPQILKNQQETIKQLSIYTHTQPEVDITIDPFKEESKEEVYLIYDDEIKRLNALKEELGPLLDLVMQREMMLHEYDYLSKLFEQRSKGQGHTKYISPIENPKQIIKEENDFRRIKNMIPRMEKKLKLALLEYKAVNGHDFELDGEPYINKLSHIILSNLEIMNSLEGHNKRTQQKSRKSLAPVIKNEDFMPKEKKDLIRRKSENCPRVSNLYQ